MDVSDRLCVAVDDFYLRVAATQYNGNLAETHNDADVHQITGGKMGDIMSQEKWPRAEFEEYLVSTSDSHHNLITMDTPERLLVGAADGGARSC